MDNQQTFEKYLVEKAPSSSYYIPDFITEHEEKVLLKNIYEAPKPKWTQLSNRRLQNWGGLPHEKGMVREKIPQWLDLYFEKLYSMNLFDGKRPNHALVNEYLPGQGIMPHVDGPLFYPTITTINLGSQTLLDFYRPLQEKEIDENTCWSSRYLGSFLLEPRSLVCFKGDMYHCFLHGIEEKQVDELNTKNILNTTTISKNNKLRRDIRISVTIRHFPKTLNVALKFGRR